MRVAEYTGPGLDSVRIADRKEARLAANHVRVKVSALSLNHRDVLMAKGMIAEDHPLSLGCIERAMRQLQRALLHSADLVLGLGYDTIEVEYEALPVTSVRSATMPAESLVVQEWLSDTEIINFCDACAATPPPANLMPRVKKPAPAKTRVEPASNSKPTGRPN